MQKVINGKRYDTATAERIAEWSNGLSLSDFNACDETLYRTPRGRFFLHGIGGALTRWRRSVGSGWTGGSGIVPLSETQAREWCEQRGVDADTIARFFPIEDA